MLYIGEELEYEVSYSVFKLGTVKLHVLDTATSYGRFIYKIKAYIDSYTVPFVTLHQVVYIEVNPLPYTYFYSAHDVVNPEKQPFYEYQFDYNKKKIEYIKGIRPENTITKKGEDTTNNVFQQDGLSIFYYARANVRQNAVRNVPTYVNEEHGNTFFNFMNKIEPMEIDAVDYPVSTVAFSGKAGFVGIFGLTGDFRGWMSNDDAAIPIVAKMKVFIGNIHIELKKWKRGNWSPPKYQK